MVELLFSRSSGEYPAQFSTGFGPFNLPTCDHDWVGRDHSLIGVRHKLIYSDYIWLYLQVSLIVVVYYVDKFDILFYMFEYHLCTVYTSS